MKSEKLITFSAVVWVSGILAVILFRDVFANSTRGIILALILAALILAATYFLMDGIWKLLHSGKEQEDLMRKAYEDKMYELLTSEMDKMNGDKIGELLEKRLDKIADTKLRKLLDEEMRKITDNKMRRMLKEECGKAFNDKIRKTLKDELNNISLNNKETVSGTDELQHMSTALQDELKQIETLIQNELKQTENSFENGLKQTEASLQNELKQTETAFQNELKLMETALQEELKQNMGASAPDNTDMETSINDTTMKAAKLLVKYTNKTATEIMRKLLEIEEAIQSLGE